MDDTHDPGAANDASLDNDAHMDPAVDDPDIADEDSSDDINKDQELTCYFNRAVLGFNRPALPSGLTKASGQNVTFSASSPTK